MYFRASNKLIYSKIPMLRWIAKRDINKKDPTIIYQLGLHCSQDFEAELSDIDELEKRFSRRGRQPKIDLTAIRELYYLFKKQESLNQKLLRENSRAGGSTCGIEHDEEDEHATSPKKYKSTVKEEEGTNVTDFRQHFLRRQIDAFERNYSHLRIWMLDLCLSLPNKLHENTPTGDEDKVIRSNVSEEVLGSDHIEVGHRLGVLRYINNTCYYLLNEAAVLELAALRFLSDILEKEMNFKPFQNPDTCNEFILRGLYVDNTEKEGFAIKNSTYRLTGTASFPSLCAYSVAGSAHQKFMPERFFSCGRRYVPLHGHAKDGLYSVEQRSNVHLLISCASQTDMNSEYDKTLQWLISLYERLGLDFRVCYKRASALHASESLRTTIQLYSAAKKQYIDVAYLSTYDSFVSSRLCMLCHDKDRLFYYRWIIDSIAISFPAILAHLLERSQSELLIPSCILPYMYKTPTNTPQAYK